MNNQALKLVVAVGMISFSVCCSRRKEGPVKKNLTLQQKPLAPAQERMITDSQTTNQSLDGNATRTDNKKQQSVSDLPPRNMRKLIEVPSPRKPEVFDPLGDAFRAEFSGLHPGSSEYKEHLQKRWNEITSSVFQRALAGDTNVLSGATLPEKATQLLKGTRLLKDELPFGSSGTEKNAGRYMIGMAGWDCISGGKVLPEILSQRANNLPPDELDLAIFYAAMRGIQELNPSTNQPVLENWQELARAKNPLYRLIALRAGMSSTPSNQLYLSTEDKRYNQLTAPAKVAFFAPFLSEKDPLILTEAVRAMGTLTSPKAKAALEQFRDTQQQVGNTALVDAANESLRSCESLLAATKIKLPPPSN